jgi:hypothetical protein
MRRIASPERGPDLSSDIIIERHILDVLGVPEPVLSRWTVWLGYSVAFRADSLDQAMQQASELVAITKLPLWLCEDGSRYRCLTSA